MKPLRYPTTQESHAYMKLRQDENKNRTVPAEMWAKAWLKSRTGLKWTQQTQWGFRIFDFKNHEYGLIVEIDGATHDASYDAYRDEYNFRRSGLLVVRVRNFNEQDADAAVAFIATQKTATERRTELRILVSGQKCNRTLSKLPYPPSLLDAYRSGGADAVLSLADRIRPVPPPKPVKVWKPKRFKGPRSGSMRRRCECGSGKRFWKCCGAVKAQ